MATGAEHYRKAELLVEAVADSHDNAAAEVARPLLLAAAQVHATLALAAATALSQAGEMYVPDVEQWEAAASAHKPGGAS